MKEEQTNKTHDESSNGVVAKTQVPAITTNNIEKLNIFNEHELLAAEAVIKKLMTSSKSGIKNVQDGIAMLVWAKDLKLPFTTIINHLHIIRDKPGFDVHIIRALMLRAGCVWEKTKDYQPQYEYTDGINCYNEHLLPEYAIKCISKEVALQKAKDDEEHIYVYPVKYYSDFNGNIYKEYQLASNKFKLVVNKQQAAEFAKQNLIPIFRIAAVPVDYITEYKFNREINNKNITIYSSFSYSDAIAAGLIKDESAYQKYPKVMVAIRAFTYGAREIADDVLNGITEYTELKNIENEEILTEDVIDITSSDI